MDDGTDSKVFNKIAQRAIRVFPKLKNAKVVRIWGALRIMAPDGYPIYQESESFPGVFCASCHSGVTLAASHVYKLASALSEGRLPNHLQPMNAKRFHNEVY